MTISQMMYYKQQKGYSLDKLSELSGVPKGTIQKIFSGETSNPNSETLYRICKALGHTMEELYDGKKAVDKEEFLSVTLIREMYENRIAELKDQHAQHIKDVKENSDDRVKTYRKAIGILVIVMSILFMLFLTYFMIDYSTEHWGIFFNL